MYTESCPAPGARLEVVKKERARRAPRVIKLELQVVASRAV